MLRIGYHISIAKSIDLSYDRAAEAGCTAMQIFVSNPRGWGINPIPEEQRKSFVSKSNIFDIKPVVAHMPYLPNLASANPENYKKSKEALDETILMCSSLGIPYLVTHLGSHLGEGVKKGIEKITEAINEASTLDNVKILLENTAGHTNSVGSNLDELVEIFDGISGKVGFCLDTCHLFAAGYDITKHDVLDQIMNELGPKNIGIFHLNDSKFELGSHKDRHDNIGRGHIGARGFKSFLAYSGIADKPLILETPELPQGVELDELGLVRKLAGK